MKAQARCFLDCDRQDAYPTRVSVINNCQLNEESFLMRESKFIVKQRDLPHWEIDGAVYFVTFNTWEKLGLTPAARQIVFDACRFFNNQRYQIFVLVIMPDHVHMLIQPLPKSEQEVWSLGSIMHSIKSYSAKQIPKVMPHIGTVWQPERYDGIIRNQQEFESVWEYIRQNPVKAELADTSEAYAFFWQAMPVVDKFLVG